MIDNGVVKGMKEQAQSIIIGVDTVYVHTDITKITEMEENGNVKELYQYHEIQYTKDEYIKIQAEKNESLQEQVEATQEALDFLLLNT